MSIDAVKKQADKLAQKQAARSQTMLPPPQNLIPVLPNIKFWRRMEGLRGGDLSPAQDGRYDNHGRRVK